jgi:hypothetical protein
MAIGDINAGYMGIAHIIKKELDPVNPAVISSRKVVPLRFESADISAKQSVNAPDLVMGDWDRDAYNYGKIEHNGTISGPITESFISSQITGESVFEWASSRDTDCGLLDFRDIELYYYCGRARAFKDFMANSLTFTAQAGEVATFSVDTIGVFAADWNKDCAGAPKSNTNDDFGLIVDVDGGNFPHYPDSEKLLTWDKLSLSINPTVGDPLPTDIPSVIDVPFQNFTFTVSNSVEPQFSLGQGDLNPYQLVEGIRQISGSLTAFNLPEFDGFQKFEDYCAGNEHQITFSLSTCCEPYRPAAPFSVTMKVRFHRIEPSLSTGVITSNLAFTGVSHQSGVPWDRTP